MRIIFIGKTDICRAPMAESIFKKILKIRNFEENIYCTSAGLAKSRDKDEFKLCKKVCQEINVDMTSFSPKSINQLKNLEDFDLFVAINKTHAYILTQAGIPEYKIYILKENIPDPFGKSLEDYRDCRDKMIGALNKFFFEIKSSMKPMCKINE